MRRRWVVALLVVIVLAAAALALAPGFDPRAAAQWLRSIGRHWWSPLAYLGAYVVFTLLFVPPVFLSAAAALMWGWLGGGVVELIAATIASVAPYVLAKSGGGDWLRQRIARRGGGPAYDRLQREGFFAVLLLRLVPVIPYVILNYVAGFASIDAAKYLAATFLGMIPSIFLFTYFVDAIAGGTENFAQALPRIFGAGAAIAALVILTRIAAHRMR